MEIDNKKRDTLSTPSGVNEQFLPIFFLKWKQSTFQGKPVSTEARRTCPAREGPVDHTSSSTPSALAYPPGLDSGQPPIRSRALFERRPRFFRSSDSAQTNKHREGPCAAALGLNHGPPKGTNPLHCREAKADDKHSAKMLRSKTLKKQSARAEPREEMSTTFRGVENGIVSVVKTQGRSQARRLLLIA